MVDDCHATGFIGKNGKGSGEHCGVLDKLISFLQPLVRRLEGLLEDLFLHQKILWIH